MKVEKATYSDLSDKIEQLRTEKERLQWRLDYIKNNRSDSIAVRFALIANDNEIDKELEEQSLKV